MPTSPNDTVLVETDGGICRITLNRPQSLNAINPDMARALRQITGEIRDDASIRVVVLEGIGNHFMAGGDVKGFKEFFDEKPSEAETRAHFEEMLGIVHEFITDFREMPKPVIASVRGAVAGAGFSVMLACDMVLASDTSFYTLAYCNLGTSPDGGSTYALPRTVGLKRAFEIALLGDRFDGEAALKAGIINRLLADADLAAETDTLAARLAGGPAVAIAKTKALLNGSLHNSLPEQLAAETNAFVDCTITTDFSEGVTAFVEKRPTRFTGV